MIYQASFTGLLKTILILIAIFYASKFIMRLAAPYLMKYAAKKMEQKMKDQFGKAPFQKPNKQQSKPKNEIPKVKKKVGEYIDFEEINE